MSVGSEAPWYFNQDFPGCPKIDFRELSERWVDRLEKEHGLIDGQDELLKIVEHVSVGIFSELHYETACFIAQLIEWAYLPDTRIDSHWPGLKVVRLNPQWLGTDDLPSAKLLAVAVGRPSGYANAFAGACSQLPNRLLSGMLRSIQKQLH